MIPQKSVIQIGAEMVEFLISALLISRGVFHLYHAPESFDGKLFACSGSMLIIVMWFLGRAEERVRESFRDACLVLRHGLTQDAADSMLARFAEILHATAEVEGEIAARVARGDEPYATFMLAQYKTQARKKEFWKAHAVVRNLGLEVSKSYKDYLPNSDAEDEAEEQGVGLELST